MNRDRFMKQLEQLLMDIPEEERREAIAYYEDYFNDAGVENEEAVLTELKSPEHVARSIKADLQGTAAGGFTEKGYEEFQEKEVPAKRGAEDPDAENVNSSDTDRVQKKTASQNNASYGKKAEYRGPFEYNRHQHDQYQNKQDSYKQNQYKQYGSYADNRKSSSAGRGQQSKHGQQYQTKRSAARRPAWATALLLVAGIVVIVVLAIAFGICGLTGIACLAAGIGLVMFATPAAGLATVGISFIFFAIFVVALLAEILFCKRVMPNICNGRRDRS